MIYGKPIWEIMEGYSINEKGTEAKVRIRVSTDSQIKGDNYKGEKLWSPFFFAIGFIVTPNLFPKVHVTEVGGCDYRFFDITAQGITRVITYQLQQMVYKANVAAGFERFYFFNYYMCS